CEQGREPAVADAFVQGLAAGRWGAFDELVLPMMDGSGPLPGLLEEAARRAGLSACSRVTGEAPYIPLPSTWNDYLKRLRGSDRYFVNRSLRDFERWAGGAERFHRASTPGELEEGKRILHSLHHERWRGTGAGVFRSSRFLAFHDRVMPRLLELGALELLWLTVSGASVAALYNIVWNHKTYFYQCG